MKPVRHTLVIATLAALSACSTVMPTAPSGYLSDDSALLPGPDGASARRVAALAIDPSQVTIAEVVWRVDARTDLGRGERDALLAHLERALRQGVQTLPAQSGGRPARIRAAITRVETVSPVFNTVASLLLIGPLDRGGAAVEMEALDPQTGQQLAALRLGWFAPLSELKARFRPLAPAHLAMDKAGHDFAALLGAPGARAPSATP